MKKHIIELIEEEYSKKTGALDLCELGLTSVPKEVLKMNWLKSLYLSNNNISKLKNLQNLTNLEKLYAFNNKIVEISGLDNLKSLKRLDLADNRIKKLEGLSQLPALKELYLSRNPVSDLAELQFTNKTLEQIFIDGTLIDSLEKLEEFIKKGLVCCLDNFYNIEKTIYLKDCPLSESLTVTIKQGSNQILNYLSGLREQGEDTIFEARLFILGEAGVGKTTLARKIFNINAKLPNVGKDTTKGVTISTFVFSNNSISKPEFKMNIWDFGGQEIYHSTHQLFLSNRSLYVIVGNGRQEDNPELYWLPIQKMLAKDSPVLLLINQRSEIRHEIPINQLKSRFPNLQGELTTIDLACEHEKISNFIDTLEYHIRRLPQFQKGEKLPRIWVTIRESLLGYKKKYMLLEDFRTLCTENGIKDSNKQKYLLKYFNDIGLILFFDVPFLNKLVILDTSWLTKAIYKLFDHTEKRNVNGIFSKPDLDEVWGTSEYESFQDEILLIMENFDLCYKIKNATFKYLVPKLVQTDQPKKIKWNNTDVIKLRYEYDVMPKGILQRLIVRKNNLISDNNHIWKYGCLFSYLDSEALVLLESQNNIIISARGDKRGSILDALVIEIDQINSDFQFFEDLKVKKLVPCICPNCLESPTPSYFEFDDLKRMQAKEITYVRCNKEFADVNIDKLLYTVFKDKNELKSTSIFISYSKDDVHYLKQLTKHLSTIKNRLNIWEDHKIMAGDNWNKLITERLYQADIIIFLVSASLFDTEYIMNIELRIAKERLEKKHDIIVIPIIIKDCNWEDSIFGVFNALPFKGKPISLFKNRDTAWKGVISEIKKVLPPK